MATIKKEKRKARSYKVADRHYFSAMTTAKKRKRKLAAEIEQFVINYSKNQ